MKLAITDIAKYAEGYDANYYDKDDGKTERFIKGKIVNQGYLTKEDYVAIGRWKSKRPTKYYKNNEEVFIREVTSIAFSTKEERIKIGILPLLKGCNYPLASVILHFKFPDKYAIIDFRVLWTLLEMDRPITYNFDLWWRYLTEVRSLAERTGLPLRTIEKALWQYSKENQ
jgi:hypothetical protein